MMCQLKNLPKRTSRRCCCYNWNIEALAKANDDYETKFDFYFIVCATGKSATGNVSIVVKTDCKKFNGWRIEYCHGRATKPSFVSKNYWPKLISVLKS
jgi:hypothetical protein